MPGPDFQGYGYGSWTNPGMFHAHGGAKGFGVLQGTPGVSQFASPGRPNVKAPGVHLRLPAWGGTTQPGYMDPTAGVKWGQGAGILGAAAKGASTLLNRSQRFQEAGQMPSWDDADQTAIGPGSRPAGSLGPGAQQGALGAAPPRTLGATATMGALGRGAPQPPGAIVMPSGPRPQGAAPTPIAIGPAGNPGAKARSRRKSFIQTPGQMQFGEIP